MADLSPELAAMLLAAVIGGYTLIGGLGATFYVSYFNTALIFILIIMLVVEVNQLALRTSEAAVGVKREDSH